MRIGSEQGLEFEELLICEMYFLVILEFCGQFAKSDEVKMLICLFSVKIQSQELENDFGKVSVKSIFPVYVQ